MVHTTQWCILPSGAYHPVVHTTQWCIPPSGAYHPVVHTTQWCILPSGAYHPVVHTTHWCILPSGAAAHVLKSVKFCWTHSITPSIGFIHEKSVISCACGLEYTLKSETVYLHNVVYVTNTVHQRLYLSYISLQKGLGHKLFSLMGFHFPQCPRGCKLLSSSFSEKRENLLDLLPPPKKWSHNFSW